MRIISIQTETVTGLSLLVVTLFVPAFVQAQTVGPSLVVPIGHSARIEFAAFSPNGKQIATASEDGTARIWDSNNGSELCQLIGHEGFVNSAQFSSDGQRVVTSSRDRTARVWDTATGIELLRLGGEQAEIYSAAFSPLAERVVTVSGDGTGQIWDARSGRSLLRLQVREKRLTSACFSPDGKTVVTGAKDGTTYVWNAMTGEEVLVLTGHRGPVQTATFDAAGLRILTSSNDGTARVWAATTGKEVLNLRGHRALFSADGTRIVTTSFDKSACVWDSSTGKQLIEIQESSGFMTSAALSPDGTRIVTTSVARIARVWDATTGIELARLGGRALWVFNATFSPDKRSILAAMQNGTPRVWNIDDGREGLQLRGQSWHAADAHYSPDGRLIVTTLDKTTRLWSSATGQLIRTLRHQDVVYTARFSLDGQRLITASEDGAAHIWDTSNGKELATFHHDGGVLSATFSPVGHHFVTACEDGLRSLVRVWDDRTSRELRILPTGDQKVWDLQFSRDGKRIAGVSTELKQGESAGELRSHDTARVWDAFTGRELLVLEGHTGPLSSVVFSPDGSRILTASWDKTARVWNASTGQELLKLRLGRPPMNIDGFSPSEAYQLAGNSAAFSPDGARILTTCEATTRIWDAKTGKELCSLISLDNGWVVTDPQGHFDCDDIEKAASELYWIAPDAPLKPLPLEIFVKQYYEPKLLARIMKGEKIPDVKNIMDLNRVQPKAEITGMVPSQTADCVDVSVKVTGMNPDPTRDGKSPPAHFSGAQDLRLFRDGRLVGHEEGTLELAADHTWTKTFKGIPLAHNGKPETEFSAYVFNDSDVKSDTVKTVYKPSKPLSLAQGKAYVISIGIDVFQDEDLELHHAADDAKLVQTSVPPSIVGYRETVPVSLVSDGVTKDALKSKVKEVLDVLSGKIPAPAGSKLAKVTPDDAVLITWSGHGHAAGDGKFYLIPSDCGTPFDPLKAISLAQAISSDELSLWLEDIDAGDMALIIDACRSSSSVEAKGFKPGPLGSKGLGQLAYDKGLMVLAASQAKAMESDKVGHGLLTSALIKDGLLGSKAKAVNGALSLRAWLSYAVDRVPQIYDEVFPGGTKQGKAKSTPDEPDDPVQKVRVTQHPQFYDFNRHSGDKPLLRSGGK
jgi:WD40 repeat protein